MHSLVDWQFYDGARRAGGIQRLGMEAYPEAPRRATWGTATTGRWTWVYRASADGANWIRDPEPARSALVPAEPEERA
ncbi:MAG: hypothetical protein GY719_26160 [bacterium]|nr:hypothetical protein [bacterium]